MLTVELTQEFRDWLDELEDRRGQLRIVARLRQAETGNLGDWKSVARELCEMRIHFGPGYRLYFTKRGGVLIVVLAGGDKSSQPKDIRRARQLLDQLEQSP